MAGSIARRTLAVAGLALAALAVPAAAEGLTLAQAIDRALAGSPLLAGAREGVTAAEARIRQADLAPALELGLELENFAGSGELEGTDALETTLQLSRAVELGGKRARRVDTAEAGRSVALADLDVTRIEVATEVARRFVAVLGAQAQVEAAGRFLELARSIRDQAERRVAAGSALSAELFRARAAVGREELFGTRARAELDIARRELGATWGNPAGVTGPVTGELFAARPVEPLDSLLARVEETPRLAQLATEQRLRDAEARLAEAEARPNLGLALGVRHLSEADDTGLVAGVSMPFGSRARARGLVAERQALARQAEAQLAAGRSAVAVTIGSLHRQLELRRVALEVLQRDVVPATVAALEQVERGYRLGRLSYGEYALAAREALDAELERLQVATEYHQLLAELEGLTGSAVRPADGTGMASKPDSTTDE